MAIEERYTDFPSVASAQLTDIILAVQGYASPTVLGTSVQETWQQVYNLFQSQTVQFNAGDPNGVLAGQTYQLCWDTSNGVLWICTTSGVAGVAVWTQITNSNSGFSWTVTNSASTAMAFNKGYINTFASAAGFVLPSVAPIGSVINLVGQGGGNWTITYGSGQSIRIGSVSSTPTTGSISSTDFFDSIELVCVATNATWQTPVAPQGNITIV